MELNDLMKNVAQADAIYREVRRQDDIFRLVGYQRESIFDQIVKNVELPSYAIKGLNDLVNPGSVFSASRHFSALEDRATAISNLDLFGGVAARSVANAAFEPAGMKNNFLTAQCGVNFEGIFKNESAIEKLVSAGAVANVFSPTKVELLNVATSINSPWINPVNPLRSVEAVAGLATLGKAVNVSPFGEKTIDTISALIGDWGKLDSVAVVPKDWMDRREFYFTHGLDSRLTDLPEPAFTQSLK